MILSPPCEYVQIIVAKELSKSHHKRKPYLPCDDSRPLENESHKGRKITIYS